MNNTGLSQARIGISKHLLDKHFTVLLANDYVYELIGYTKLDFQARFHNHIDEYYAETPSVFDYITKEIWKAYERHEDGYEMVCPLKRKRGKITWIYISGKFTKDSYRGIPVIFNVLFDITALKNRQIELEEKLAQLSHELETALKEKQELSELLSLLSPNIRTSINLVTGMTDIARVYPDDKKLVEECLDKISHAILELRTVVNIINKKENEYV